MVRQYVARNDFLHQDGTTAGDQQDSHNGYKKDNGMW